MVSSSPSLHNQEARLVRVFYCRCHTYSENNA
nr:MAG TPA: hypothetical protein [Caudoviricetes sp.]